MSPLLAALLRQHPAQWAAAGDALAAVARRAAARSFLPRLDPHARARARTTAGFGEVWAVAARVAASGVFSSAGGSSAAVARVSAGPARFAAAVFANLRAPSALFVLGHHARDAVLARRLPNFSGVLVMLLVGGRGFAPATALCLERRAERHADEGKRDRSSADEGSRSIGRVLVPANGAERSWMDGVSPSFRDLVERALTALRALHLSVLFAPAVALAPLLLYAGGDAGAALWYRLLRRTLELGGAAFIKWGQWASTRYDVFPAQLCRELEELQASAPEHSWRRTKQILERAYGAEQVEEIFVWMDPRPIASGSIAQIHRAKLKIGVAEANGGGPELGFQQRLLRSAQAGWSSSRAASGDGWDTPSWRSGDRARESGSGIRAVSSAPSAHPATKTRRPGRRRRTRTRRRRGRDEIRNRNRAPRIRSAEVSTRSRDPRATRRRVGTWR